MMTTTETFDLEGYLKDFGRLTYVRPLEHRHTLIMKPGKPPEGKKGVDESARIIYPGRFLTSIFPTDIPETMLPMIVGPAFEWDRGAMKETVAKLILECDIVYDESEDDGEDLADLAWQRMHAAYLVNEIAPGKEITVKEWRTAADRPAFEEPRAEAPKENAPRSLSDILSQLLTTDDDDDPFDFEDPFDFDLGDESMNPRLNRRTVTSTDWLAELMPIARAHFSFYTNSIVIAKPLFERCTPADDLSGFVALLKEKPRKTAENHIRWAKKSLDIYHAHAYRYLAELAESTPAQRMDLFDQMVRVENAKHVRATLGDRLIVGSVFGTEDRIFRRAYNTFEFMMVLLTKGLLSVDVERRTFDITEGAWKVIDILRKCPHVNGYEDVIVDISAGTTPFSAATPLEDWVIHFFETLRGAIAQEASAAEIR
jgi:hypothetical protein